MADRIVRASVAWSVVIGTILLAIVSGFFAAKVAHDDDVLAFLPRSDPDVAAFYDINRRFGGLELALVGVQTEDVLDPSFFEELRAATKALDESPTIDFALSLANVDDFVPASEGGIEIDRLVRDVPADPEARRALRDKVLARDLVVGQLVSEQLDAALILVAPAACDGDACRSDPRAFADEVEATARRTMPGRRLHFGGAPFVSSYVYAATQSDLSRLTPWAVAAIVLLIFVGFRDLAGAAVVLFSTAVGIAASMAVMFGVGVEHNILLSSMPVIAFSVGSAYGLHVLARYQQLARRLDREAALKEALVSVGPTVIAAGLTTVAGLFSFLAMDIAPMRMFGLFTGLGVSIALVLSLTFVPAAIRVAGLKHPRSEERGGRLLVGLVVALRSRRAAALAFVLAVAAIGAVFAARVDTRMDLSTFFADDSPPARADRFLLEEFGGSQFVQVHVRGDFTEPAALWQLVHLADRIERLESVTSVQHVGQVVAQLDLAMEGTRRIPPTREKVQLLFRLLTGRAAIGQLVSEDRKEAVVHAKLGRSDVDAVEKALADVEAIVAAGMTATPRAVVATRIAVATERAGVAMDGTMRGRVAATFEGAAPTARADAVADRLAAFFASDESPLTLPRSAAEAAATAIVTSGSPDALRAALLPHREALEDPLDDLLIEDLLAAAATPIEEARQRLVAFDRSERVRAAIGHSIRDRHWQSDVTGAIGLVDRTSLIPSIPLVARVSGLPVLHRGLSRSTVDNQLTSLVLALISVLLVLTIAFRSVAAGLLAASPTIVTLLVVYGGMGALDVHLDIGTAMLASLVIGAGVDYAVHFVTAWREEPSIARAVARTAAAIWTNAFMVAAGFFILTLGEAKTLQNVGGLTAAAMLTAALATFVCVPVLARRGPVAEEAIPAEVVVAAREA